MTNWMQTYWVEVGFGLILTLLGLAYRKIIKEVRQQKAIEEGIKALLWDRLYVLHDEACTKGYMSVDGLKNATNIYTQYHALGGNGVGTDLYERLKKLPRKECNGGKSDEN